MKWITLLVQLLSLRSRFFESSAMMENAMAAAERGKKAAVFSGFILLALVYFLVGSILCVVELGLQFDREGSFSITGLLVASFFFLFLAGIIVGIGALVTSNTHVQPPKETHSDLKVALEEVAVSFLKQLSGKLKEEKK
jgi:hypothetical protein